MTMSVQHASKKKSLGGEPSKKNKPGASKKPRVPSPESDRGVEEGELDQGVLANINSIYDDPMIDEPATSASSDHVESGEEEGNEDQDIIVDESKPGTSTTNTKRGLYRPPTLEELDRLEKASSSGNTFTLQLEHLLSSTLLPLVPAVSLKTFLAEIHSHILSLPSLAGVSPREASERLKGTEIPWVGPAEFIPTGKGKEAIKWTLGWERPSEIVIGGSWGVCGGYRKGKGEAGGIDMVVVMPESLFSPKDRMSYRYFHKRSHYLAVIFSAIFKMTKSASSPLHGASVRWENVMGDARRPIIVILAGKEQGLKHNYEIRIHTSAPPNLFVPSTISPSKSLIRSSTEDSGTSETHSTPLYATSLIQETLYKSNLLHLHRLSQLLTPHRTIDSVLALWRIWCARRGISKSRGGSAWFASLAVGFVVDGGEIGGVNGDRGKTKKMKGLGRGLGAWRCVRASWEFLAHTDFEKTPVFMTSTGDSALLRSEFINSFEEVFVDATGSVNIFSGWEKGDIQLLRHHARETLAMLEDPSVDRFADVFLRPQAFGLTSFDDYLLLNLSGIQFKSANLWQRSEHPSQFDRLTFEIAKILRQGLGDRARLVSVSPSDSKDRPTLSLGIVFNPQNATRVMDIGPSAEQAKEAGEVFRQLWGEKAELRRFKDGSISESVVWNLSRPEDATTIPSRIVKWLLSRHFEIGEESIVCLSSDPQWLSVVQTPPTAREAVHTVGSERLGFRPVVEAYESLYKILKSIDDQLPLAILHVTPSSEFLRYSSVFVPHPVDLDRFTSSPDCLKWLPAIDIVMQFESSPRWPDDLAAIQKVKMAMFERLARVVSSRVARSKVSVVFDRDTTEIEDGASLEILLPQGIAFHLRIWHEREKVLLERILEEDNTVALIGTALPKPPRRLVLPALKLHLDRFIHKPQHHSSIAPLHHRFPSFSSATRLLKRWFSSHLLSNHINPETLELLMASIYLDPKSRQIPSSATTGFVRAIELLSTWEWKDEPLFVPVFTASQEASFGRTRYPEQKRKNALESFERARKGDKEISKGAWIVVTENDIDGIRWTEDKPGKVVAGRIRALARATMEALSQTETGVDVKSLFKSPLDHYDLVIHLNKSLLTRYAQAVEPDAGEWETKLKYRNVVDGGVYGTQVRVQFDPAETFIEDLQRLHGDTMLVFYDNLGGNVIGLLWNPSKEQPRNLKPFIGFSTKPVQSESSLVEINKEAVIAEIGRLGEGLIQKIVSNRV